MNLCASNSKQGAFRERAFTMIEIAIALAVIAIALIAIIGILPTGLQTQRDNREETLVAQDARLLIEAIKGGGRDISSDLGSYVVKIDHIDPTDYSKGNPPGIPTKALIQLLTDGNVHEIMMSSVSGAAATRQSDLGFRYQVRNDVTNSIEFTNSILADQVYEVRLRFAWPVQENNQVNSEASRYIARCLVAGALITNVFYAQQYYQPPYQPRTNSQSYP